MKKNVMGKMLFLSMLLLLLSPICSSASQETKVGLVYFSIIADSGKEHFQKLIPSMIAKTIEKDGAKTVFLEEIVPEAWPDKKGLQDSGIKYGVDYVIWGSVFVTGESFSIDASLINVFESGPPVAFAEEARGIENLNGAVNDLAKKISSEIFKKQLISTITVTGNYRIESDAILRKMDTKSGDIFSPEGLSSDLKSIYKLGYFDDVRIESQARDPGVMVTVQVTEKQSVRKVILKGNKIYDEDEITDVIKTRTGSILNVYTIEEDIVRIKAFYTEKNYHNCIITYEIESLENNQADIRIAIEEGPKLMVRRIAFVGNTYFTDKKIKKEMETREKGFFSWITSSGDLDKDELNRDIYRIESLYKNNGFVDARVSDPVVEYGKEMISVTFKIEEGPQYRIGTLTFKGDMLLPEEELLKKIKLKEADLFSRETIRRTVLAITDLYSDQGYANADVAPFISRNEEEHLININFNITQGSPVYFERIMISGNSKTRDKVIRRQLKVYEQDLYSLSKIQKSVNNLRRIDYFEDIEVKTSKGEEENTMDLDFVITEKATGNFSFGAGYSSEDNLFGTFEIAERNLFGRGQEIAFEAEISGSSSKFVLSFTEPWLFDIPLNLGFDLYNWDKEYDYYDKDTKGGAIRFGYMIFDYTYLGMKYEYEDFDITSVQEEYTDVTEGRYITSSITPSLSWDSRNAAFNATRGSKHGVSIQYAGDFLGGEIDFTKYIAETSWYIPLFWKFTGYLRAKGGYLEDRTSDDIDIDFERFYLGGIDSVRGYDSTEINAGYDDDEKVRGGEQFVQLNIELIFPLVETAGVKGVVFYDMGDVYRKEETIDLGDLYTSVGAGFRWYSPVGPIRVEYGMILNGKEYETGEGRWEFSMGTTF